MDRELPSSFKRKNRIKFYFILGSIVILFSITFIILKIVGTPTVKLSQIAIATTEIGIIEATIPAKGIVVPEYEFVITSPIRAKIEEVFLNSGDNVKEDQSILKLNKETTLMNYDKLVDEQEVNRNKIDQLKLNSKKDINDLNTQYLIKQMRIQSLEASVKHELSLLKIGGGTPDRVKQAELSLDIANLELAQLRKQIANQKETMDVELKNLGFQISIHNKNISEMNRKLNQAEVRSPANGVITWVNDQIGSEIAEGSEIARIANLNSFKIEASISDSYALQLKIGGEVIIRIDDTDLRGEISNIQPAVKNGTVNFVINLKEKNNQLLRSNLKVDVFIVTSLKSNVIRLVNGSAFNGSSKQKVFVVDHNNTAFAREISVGESNFNYIEIKSGLKPGEKVIITDMQEYINHDKLSLK